MSLTHALFTDRKSRIFRWLFGLPERSFHLNELLRLTQLGSASLQQELKQLTAAGLVSTERVGNLKMFQANPNSPVFKDLVSLTRKTVGLPSLLTQALIPLKNKLLKAWIYGSVAQQTDTGTSDVDIMLVGHELRLSEVMECLQTLEVELGRRINPTCYSDQEFTVRLADPDSFVSQVLQKPVVDLLEQHDGA
ncbi:MAG: transcriptional regulator [Limnohabitans sp.]|nr:transcriptional regulator [Limnohabitans sp.]